jgi:hypothetical protein
MGRRARDTRRTARLQRASLTATTPGPGVRLRNSVHKKMTFTTVSWCGAARAASLSLRVSRVTRMSSQDGARRRGLVQGDERGGEWKSKQ